MASDLPGQLGCLAAQASMAASISDGSRMAVTGSLPVAGRPAPGRLPPLDLGISFFIWRYYNIQTCQRQAAGPGVFNHRDHEGPDSRSRAHGGGLGQPTFSDRRHEPSARATPRRCRGAIVHA
jgi:hypothetical protein